MAVNRFDILAELRKQLVTAVPENDVQRENDEFDPVGKDVWYRETLILSTERQTAFGYYQVEGIYQVDVMHRRGTLTKAPLDQADAVKDAFEPPLGLGNLVQVYRAEVLQASDEADADSRFYPVRVYWRAFEQK